MLDPKTSLLCSRSPLSPLRPALGLVFNFRAISALPPRSATLATPSCPRCSMSSRSCLRVTPYLLPAAILSRAGPPPPGETQPPFSMRWPGLTCNTNMTSGKAASDRATVNVLASLTSPLTNYKERSKPLQSQYSSDQWTGQGTLGHSSKLRQSVTEQHSLL